jgi:hypothetical protein
VRHELQLGRKLSVSYEVCPERRRRRHRGQPRVRRWGGRIAVDPLADDVRAFPYRGAGKKAKAFFTVTDFIVARKGAWVVGRERRRSGLAAEPYATIASLKKAA